MDCFTDILKNKKFIDIYGEKAEDRLIEIKRASEQAYKCATPISPCYLFEKSSFMQEMVKEMQFAFMLGAAWADFNPIEK